IKKQTLLIIHISRSTVFMISCYEWQVFFKPYAPAFQFIISDCCKDKSCLTTYLLRQRSVVCGRFEEISILIICPFMCRMNAGVIHISRNSVVMHIYLFGFVYSFALNKMNGPCNFL